jgi:hypothetical protein
MPFPRSKSIDTATIDNLGKEGVQFSNALTLQQYVRPSNLVEWAFEEERRRTKVIPYLWDEQSLLQLVFAVLIRVSERWGKKQCSAFEQHQIRALRQGTRSQGSSWRDLANFPLEF